MVIAKYLRFSKDDGKDAEHESIKNQRDLLDSFISKSEDLHGCEAVEFFDDGFTGMNFQRPGFQSMLDAVKQQKVTCIIVKDFSRFGRNYIEVSDYIDQIFPFLGIRFIAVNDHYDSKTAVATLGVDMAMKNLIYDLYSKDLSKKIKSARKTLAQKGYYIAPYAFYGYTNKVEKKRLIIDPPAAEVVRRMFEYAVNGKNARYIALRLNEEGILTPNAYNKSKSTIKRHYVPMDTAAIWTGDIVRHILQDERYTGKLVCGKHTTENRKAILLPKEKWIVTPGTHEAIVSEDVFKQAQKVFRTRTEFVRPDKPKSILVGMLKCAHCNKSLVFEGRSRRRFYCHNFNMGIGCEQATIAEPELIETIYSVIKTKLELVQASEQSLKEKQQSRVAKFEAERRECEFRLLKLKTSQKNLLEQFLEGKLSKENELTMTDSTGTTTRAYDALNRVTRKIVPIFGTTTFAYDITTGLSAGHWAEETQTPDNKTLRS